MSAARIPLRKLLARLSVVMIVVAIGACQRKDPTSSRAAARVQAPRAEELAASQMAMAHAKMGASAPDEALAIAVSALRADPQSQAAREFIADLLRTTRWYFPHTEIAQTLPIERIAVAGSSVWVGLQSDWHTMLRWNLESLQIDAVLFPLRKAAARSLVLSPRHDRLVIERAGATLLCDAQSLQPLRDLGPLPVQLVPDTCVVFSPDGLLFAHPVQVNAGDPAIIWHLRDSATGEIIRSSDPSQPGDSEPVTAYLDRQQLRILHRDGSMTGIPVSPTQKSQLVPGNNASIVSAAFASDGASAMILNRHDPHQEPAPEILALPSREFDRAAMLQRHPWSRHPSIWSELWHDPRIAPLDVRESEVILASSPAPPLRSASKITAVAMIGEQFLTGDSSGAITLFMPLPLPSPAGKNPPATTTIEEPALQALANLTEGLAAWIPNIPTPHLKYNAATRLNALNRCDWTALQAVFPDLDFSPLKNAIASIKLRSAAPAAQIPLWDRLARADTTGETWPTLLEKAQALADTAWHRDLSAALLARHMKNSPANPWLAGDAMRQTFRLGNPQSIAAALKLLPGNGPAAAAALEQALALEQPLWIQACLDRATAMPPILRQLATSRIAWLEGRKADAMAPWPESFPDIGQIRLRENWDAWEQADFAPAFARFQQCLRDELSALEMPPNPDPAQRKAIIAKLSDPATLKAVGKNRFARACLKAALELATIKEESSTTLMMAARARELGAPPAPCLRAEAIALTAMGQYRNAHARWINLITDHPVDAQQPGDYAEAAYTAFENSDSRQAMAILATGMHRFPKDANFALRAGWVALLTGNAERAYRFLLTGQQLGFPAAKQENATALLAIAAEQTGLTEDADAYYQDLIRIDPAWSDPNTLESLPWPTELKDSLRNLVR